MVHDYFAIPPAGMTQEQHKRSVAVAAALSVAKESVSASTSATGSKTAWICRPWRMKLLIWPTRFRMRWRVTARCKH